MHCDQCPSVCRRHRRRLPLLQAGFVGVLTPFAVGCKLYPRSQSVASASKVCHPDLQIPSSRAVATGGATEFPSRWIPSFLGDCGTW